MTPRTKKAGFPRPVFLSAPARSGKPRLVVIHVFREQLLAVLGGIPIGIKAADRAEIGHLHVEAALVIHLVGLDDATLRVLQRPDHAGEHGEVTCMPVAFW